METSAVPKVKGDEKLADLVNSQRSSSPVSDKTITAHNHTLRKRPWRTQVTDFEAIIAHDYSGSGTESDPYIVTWLEHDAENPLDYPLPKKITVVVVLAFTCLSVSLASSAYTGAAEEIIEHFHCSREVFTLGLSLYVLGFGLGPLLWSPLSEIIGRRKVIVTTLAFYTLWTAVCAAAQNIQTLLVFRFLAGTIGAACMVVPIGNVADLFRTEYRGMVASVFSATPWLGPTLGPIIGGFLSPAAGWRWLFGFLALFSTILVIATFLLMPETYASVLLRDRAARLSKATGKRYMIQIDVDNPVNVTKLARRTLIMPWKLFLEPIVLFTSIYQAVIYGTLYLCFAAYPIVFGEERGWNAGETGLAFVGMMVGIFVGVGWLVIDNEKRYRPLHKKMGGFAPPEARLPPVIFGGAVAIIGFAWFAGTVAKGIPWAAPIVGSMLFGIGFVVVFMNTANYLIDSYIIYAASVSASMSILRSAFGAIFPLFTTYMYHNLGVSWASSVPAFIALLCFPFPIIFWKYGAVIRRKCKHSAEAARILDSMKSSAERKRSVAGPDGAEPAP